MGFWDKFTKTAVQDPNTGEVHFYDSPAAAGIAEAKASAQTAQPALETLDNQIPPEGQSIDPGFQQPPPGPMPKIFKPSFEQASENQYGLPAKNTPGLTRLGKLMQVLVAAGKGAVAGQAASAQAVAASGGHRGGSFGLGFEAAERAPFEDIAREQNAQQGAIATQMAQQNLQPVQTPWGMMPMWQAQRRLAMQKDIADIKKAGIVTPRNGGVYNTQTQQYEPGTEPMDKTRLPVPGVDIPFSPEVEAQKGRLAENKPDTAAQLKQNYMGAIDKVAQEGLITPDTVTSLPKMAAAIKASKSLTEPEKSATLAYMAANPTPASQGSIANLRIEGLGQTRGQVVFDTKSNTLAPVTWEEINRAAKEEPGRYVAGNVLPTIDANGQMSYQPSGVAVPQGSAPAAGGQNVMAKQAQFLEMHFAAQKAREAIKNVEPMTPLQIGKLTMAMRHTDPTVFKTAMDTFLGSEQLTPAQEDFVTWISQLNERALSLRNVAGMGQGAQDMRNAIAATLPGLKSGNKSLMNKQLDAFENQVSLLEKGVPKIKGQAQAAQSKGTYPKGFTPF